MDVLRTARAGAEHRRRLFLAVAGEGRPRPPDSFTGGLDGARLWRASGDGESPQDQRLFRRPPAHGGRYRAVRLYPPRGPLRLRPLDLPGDPGLAEARGSGPRLVRNGRAPGRHRGPRQHRRWRLRGAIALWRIAGIRITIAAISPFSLDRPPQYCRLQQ